MAALNGGVGVVAVEPSTGEEGGTCISSPTGIRYGAGYGDRKRNRSMVGPDSSPGSVEEAAEDDDGGDDRRRSTIVKRACNECRQQKVSGDRAAAMDISLAIALTASTRIGH